MYHLTGDLMMRMHMDFPNRAMQALLQDNYESNGERYYGFDQGYVFDSLEGMLSRHAKSI